MNVTNNLKLPQYTEEDIFDLQDINKAYDSIDNAYKEVIDFKNEIPKTNATAEVINARGGKETLGKRLDEFGSQLDTIVYLLPPSNGIDDTETIQNAINNYKKVQLNGVHIISNLTINNDVEIIGKNKRSDILRQKSGSTGNAITSNGLLSLNNITVKG